MSKPEKLTYTERLSASENHRGYDIRTPDGFAVAHVQPIDEDGKQGLVYANRFVASEELLKALQDCLQWLTAYAAGNGTADDIRATERYARYRAAIKAAEGEG